MTPADTFRRAYEAARAAGYPCSRRAFADLVLCAPTLFTSRLRRAAVAWAKEHPAPEVAIQRRHGWLRPQDVPHCCPPPLRVVRDEPADRLLDHLGLDKRTNEGD